MPGEPGKIISMRQGGLARRRNAQTAPGAQARPLRPRPARQRAKSVPAASTPEDRGCFGQKHDNQRRCCGRPTMHSRDGARRLQRAKHVPASAWRVPRDASRQAFAQARQPLSAASRCCRQAWKCEGIAFLNYARSIKFRVLDRTTHRSGTEMPNPCSDFEIITPCNPCATPNSSPNWCWRGLRCFWVPPLRPLSSSLTIFKWFAPQAES